MSTTCKAEKFKGGSEEGGFGGDQRGAEEQLAIHRALKRDAYLFSGENNTNRIYSLVLNTEFCRESPRKLSYENQM